MDDLFNLGFCLFLLIFYNCWLVSGSTKSAGVIVSQSDYQSLQALKHDLIDPRGVLKSWNNNNNSACSGWAGIKCVNGYVIAIQLPWKGLSGRISENIGQLRSLRRIGLHDNLLVGPVPASLGLLPNLRGVYLFNNRLSGSIPPSIGNCLVLQTLDLSNNRLTGFIPPGLANSTRLYRLILGFNGLSGPIPDSLSRSASLTFLALQNNNLTGSVPDNWGGLSVNGSYRLSSVDLSRNNLTGEIPISLVNLKNLSSFNVSYNNLSGPVPSGLAEKFNSTSFVGNAQLCGYTGSGPCHKNINLTSPPQGEIKNHHRRRRLSTRDIIVIAAVSLLIVLLILLCCVFLCFLIRKKSASKPKKGKTVNSAPAAAPSGEADSGGGGGKLVHFDGNFVFTADDLLCATAEMMGKSAYGTAYKTTLEDINRTVAVKRLREKITKLQTEFELEVSALGKIRHANIVALRAYYLGPKGEKLLVYDYLPNGSLASFLHARGPETSIPWHTRMTIATGITRGLSFLHAEENKIVHGNLTSSNILLDEHNNPQIAHAGLARLMTSESAGTNPIATAGTMGYRAPELSKQKNAAAASAKADVFSLGVFMLELLTGKSPSEMKDGLDLAQWAALAVKDGRTNELFDVEMTKGAEPNGDEMMINTLKLALHCVDPSAAARPEARQVLEKLEEMKAREDVSKLPATEDV